MDKVEIIIIGGGVVGVAIARTLALQQREVLLIEKESEFGTQISARNSGVIHAGLYYWPNSLKAKLCVKGRHLLYAYAREHGIAHKYCGKLVVATLPEHVPVLEDIKINANLSNVFHLLMLDGSGAKTYEPQLKCLAALYAPMSGQIDVGQFLQTMIGEAETQGALLVPNTSFVGAKYVGENSFIVQTAGVQPFEMECRFLINAAGLSAQRVAKNIHGLAPGFIPQQVLAKGSYFSLSGKPPFSHLIYPLPTEGSSGLHYACDLGGVARFGPDVEWVEEPDYVVSENRRDIFVGSIRQYWPEIEAKNLMPDFAGVRPKLAKSGPLTSDFVIQTEAQHTLKGLVNLYGIESPGLTASLAIGEYVASLI